MKLSAMTYSFAQQRHPSPPQGYPALIAKAGVQGINWVTGAGLSPEEVIRCTKDAGLEISSYTFALSGVVLGKTESEYLAEAEVHFKFAGEIDAKRVMVVPQPVNRNPNRDESRAKWCEIYKKLQPMAKANNVIMTVENFQGATSPFVTAADLLEVKNAVEEIRFTFDAGNAATGEDPLYTLDHIHEFIEFVHIKDWTLAETAVPGATAGINGKFYLPALPGEGILDIPGILAGLKRYGYEGFIDIEYEGKEAAEKVVEKVASYMRSLPGNYFS